MGELGVQVEAGILRFDPFMLRDDEFLTNQQSFEYINLNKEKRKIELEKGTLGFTYCQVPIVYKKAKSSKIEVHLNNGELRELEGNKLDGALSSSIFKRKDEVNKLVVFIGNI